MEYNPYNEEHVELMEYLISEGAATIDGIDEDGEPVYKFDMDVLEEVMPELHQSMIDDMDKVLLDLFEKGLIDISYDENLNAEMTISEEGKEALEKAGFDMSDSEEEEL